MLGSLNGSWGLVEARGTSYGKMSWRGGVVECCRVAAVNKWGWRWKVDWSIIKNGGVFLLILEWACKVWARVVQLGWGKRVDWIRFMVYDYKKGPNGI